MGYQLRIVRTPFVGTSVRLPLELKDEMVAAKKKYALSWSAVAVEAFRKVLKEIAEQESEAGDKEK